MKVTKAFIYFLLPAFLFITAIICCSPTHEKYSKEPQVPLSYHDIPGVTAEEIEKIENLKINKKEFTLGMIPSTEAFVSDNGEIRGYFALFGEWASELFGIKFIPKHYSWTGLLDGLASGEIDFTGDLTPNEERRKTYIMTGAIAQRSLKYILLEKSTPLAEIRQTRLPRYILQEKTTIVNDVWRYAGGTFEPVYITEYEEAYDLLKSGRADALITESVQEAFWDNYNDIIVKDFFPLIYSPVSLTTQNQDLSVIISVIQKLLDREGINIFNELIELGYGEYYKHKLSLKLTDEELNYIKLNPIVPLVAEYDNYPVSFYSEHNNEWQGISFDVLKQIEFLTGLQFLVVNKNQTEFQELFDMLEAGKAHIITELVSTPEREGRFIWPRQSFMTETSVLVSRVDYRKVYVDKVYSEKIGLSKGTAHTEYFLTWFPNHPNTIMFDTQGETFDALVRGKVDMMMTSYSTLLYLTNYMELAGFKANIVFDNHYESTFGINKNMSLLRSVIDKSLKLIDTRAISEEWRHRAYDYNLKIAEAKAPLLVLAVTLSFLLFSLIVFLLLRTRNTGKKMEELVHKRTNELAMQTTTLTTLFDSIPDLIFTKDLNLKFLHCNMAFLNHFNREIDDIVGNHDGAEMGMIDEDVKSYTDIDRKVINEKRTITIEEHIPHFDGSRPFYETIKMPLLLDDKVVGILGISRNITERKKLEDKMALRYEYSKKLSDALSRITKSPSIFSGILKDAAATVAEMGCNALNTHRIGIWSHIENEKILKNICSYDTFTSENTVHENYNLENREEYLWLLKTERLIVMNTPRECLLITEPFDGYEHLCAELDAPIRVDGKLFGVVCVEQWVCREYQEKREWTIEEQNFASSLADVMALAISGSERHKSREAAEQANRTKSAFLANMSHEIRTPMNAILGVTELLIQNEDLPENIEEGLETIYSSCDLLLGIINDILDFSKIEAGKLDIMPTQYKVASMINDSIHLNMMRIESKPITFELHIDEKIPARLIGDELRIKQILNNLLSNAFKYTDSGKVTLSVDIEDIPLISYQPDHLMSNQVKWLGDDRKGITLMLSVQDTGHGMTKEQLNKMFDEYSRFNREKNITIEGTGLGLAITQRLIRLMDGNITVESEPKKGSLFVVRLPQEIVDDEILGKEAADDLRQFRRNYITHRKKGPLVRDPMPYGSVLIVDDVETNVYVAVGLMKLYRLQIDTAMNGKNAIEKIKGNNKYDVIFMDHMMPEMDGIETTKKIRDLGYSEPIVALTANAVAGQADMFIQNGFDDFISKPIDIRQLNSILNKFVRDKQPQEVIENARKQIGIDSITPRIEPLLLESFLRDAGKAITWLEERRRATDYEDEEILRKFVVIVHGIKSSLWNINENDLADIAYKMETGGREKNIVQITATTPDFLNQLRALVKKLELNRSKNENNIGHIDEDIEELRHKLKAIQKRAADYDKKGVSDIISGMKNCSKETKVILDKIMSLTLHSEFEEAERIISFYEAGLFIENIDDHDADKIPVPLKFRKIHGLDLEKGLERYGNDEEIYLKVLRSYSSCVGSMLGAIENVSEDGIDQYKIKVHGIKGTSLDIFAEQIGRTAQYLEEAAKSADIGYIREHNPEFLESAWKLVRNIEEMLAKLEAENPKPKKDKPDKEQLLNLLSACREYEINRADKAIAEIEKYKYESDEGLADWLRLNIDKMNFKQIVEKLAYLDNK